MINIYLSCKDGDDDKGKSQTAAVISLRPGDDEPEDMQLELYVRLNASAVVEDQPHKPNETSKGHDFMEIFPNYTRPNPWILVIPESVLHPCETGIYLGILPICTWY